MVKKIFGVIVLIMGLSGGALAAPTLTVESAMVEPNGTCIINVRYSGVPNGLLAIQVGPEGALTYDPEAVEITSIAAVQPFQPLYIEDDGQGNIKFALVSGDTPTEIGTILQLTVHAIGSTGTDTHLSITYVDDSIDGNEEQIPSSSWQLIPGLLKINSPPEVDFTWESEGTLVRFQSDASDVDGFVATYSWDFGDGTAPSGEANPVHRYAQPGSYAVTLRVFDDDGAAADATHTVTVGNMPPEVDFYWTPSNPTTSDVVQFIDNSIDPDGTIESWEWDFGDGSTKSNLKNPTHQYAVPGTYNVTLTCTDDRGASTSCTRTIEISNSPPRACFTYSPQNPSTSDTIQFTDCSTDPDGEVVSWSWEFGDGHTASAQNPTHRYAQDGVYTVRLTVTDNNGASDYVEHQVSVGNMPPVPDFDVDPPSPFTGEVVHFIDKSQDPDGNIVEWLWDFGDGEVSTDASPSHVYRDNGTYTVRLTVTDDDGATAFVEKTVTVQNTPPQADFSYSPHIARPGEDIQFVDESTDPDGQIVAWLWDFDDGSTSNVRNPVHSYAEPGVYEVELRVTDNDGSTDTVTKCVTVQGVKADFTWEPFSPLAMEEVHFTDMSVSSEANIVTWSWNFGDGTTSAERNPTHVFEDDGIYQVTLSVTTDKGDRDVATHTIEVQNAPPVPDFTFTPSQPKIGEEVEFNASGTVDPDGDDLISFQWDFNGDGNIDLTGSVVTYVFTTGGTKQVTLNVTDSDGGQGSITKTVPIGVNAPVADFTYEPQYPSLGELVTFDASPSYDPDGTIQFYEWDFNDDGKADRTGKVATWVFTQGGTNYVTLRVTDNEGNVGSITKGVHVRINNAPIADFTYEPENPAAGEEVQFTDRSTDPDGEIVEWFWDFGDGSTSTEQNPVHVFEALGNYQVTLTVTDDQGSESSVTKTVSVANAPPEADFTWTPPHPAAKQRVTFTAEATDPDPGDRVVAYTWDFGDGTAGEGEEVVHVFEEPGSYEVKLTVTDTHGASTDVRKTVTVGDNRTPTITSLSFTPTNPEVGSSVTFNAVASDPEGNDIIAWQWDFGDDSTSTQAPPVTHTYKREGIYTVKVRAKDVGSEQWSAWKEKSIYVRRQGGPEIGSYVERNPVSTQATIVYFLPAGATNVKLSIFDLMGRRVFEEDLNPAANTYSWNLRTSDKVDVPSGLYFFVITAEKDGRTIRSAVGRILVVR